MTSLVCFPLVTWIRPCQATAGTSLWKSQGEIKSWKWLSNLRTQRQYRLLLQLPSFHFICGQACPIWIHYSECYLLDIQSRENSLFWSSLKKSKNEILKHVIIEIKKKKRKTLIQFSYNLLITYRGFLSWFRF